METEDRSSQSEQDKIVWIIGDGEPITWDEYCLRMKERREQKNEL